MARITEITLETPVSEVITSHPETVEVFVAYGVDPEIDCPGDVMDFPLEDCEWMCAIDDVEAHRPGVEPPEVLLALASAAHVVERLATAVVEDLPFESGDRVLAFVNGMGGTPLIELYIVYRELHRFLEGRGVTIDRRLIGNYITSLEMAGCSITLLRLDEELTRLWDAPADTPALRVC
jgi:hypothetical protein